MEPDTDGAPPSARSTTSPTEKAEEAGRAGLVGRLLRRLVGVDERILAGCATNQRTKYSAVGMAMVCTAAMAAFSTLVIFATATNAPPAALVLAGTGVFVVVLVFDAVLVRQIAREDKQRLGATILRVVATIALGILTAEPAVLALFNRDVQNQLQREARVELKQAQEDRTTAQSRITELNNQAAALRRGENTADSARIKELDAQDAHDARTVADLQRRADEAQALLEPEETGQLNSGVGRGQIYASRNAEFMRRLGDLQEAKSRAESTKRERDRERQELRAKAIQSNEPVAKAYEEQARTLDEETLAALDNTKRTATNDTGLLARLRALHHIEARNPIVLVMHVAIVLVLVAIDLSPLAAKIAMTRSDDAEYEIRRQAEIAKARREKDLQRRRYGEEDDQAERKLQDQWTRHDLEVLRQQEWDDRYFERAMREEFGTQAAPAAQRVDSNAFRRNGRERFRTDS